MHTTASNVTRPESLLGRTHVIPAIITHILRNYRALLNKPSRNAPIYIQVASLSSSNMQGTILPVSSFKKINRVAQSQRAEVDSRVQLRVHACQAPGLPGGGTAPRPQEGPHPGGLSCCVDEGWEGGRFPSRPPPRPVLGAARREAVPRGGRGSDLRGALYRGRDREHGSVRGRNSGTQGESLSPGQGHFPAPIPKSLC